MYRDALEVDFDDIPVTSPEQHTMGSAVDKYVTQRLPTALLDMAAGSAVEVHGIYPAHLSSLVKSCRGIHNGYHFAPRKAFNLVRPGYFIVPAGNGSSARKLIVAVPPGRDYVLHYASLIRHYLPRRGGLARVVRYPEAERTIGEWTGLGELVRPGDRLLVGFVRELLPHLLAPGGSVVGETASEFYGVTHVSLPGGRRLCLLGVRFSFWGCISARLAETCARLGADEIVYVGKLGTLTSPRDIYERLFVPSAFRVHGKGRGNGMPENRLLSWNPALDSGGHISVATVLEEDTGLRAIADAYGACSIDNEIAQMANALASLSSEHETSFASIHFATDYLRAPGEGEGLGQHDLTSHRTADALRLKARMIARIAAILRSYYLDTTPGDRLSAAAVKNDRNLANVAE